MLTVVEADSKTTYICKVHDAVYDKIDLDSELSIFKKNFNRCCREKLLLYVLVIASCKGEEESN